MSGSGPCQSLRRRTILRSLRRVVIALLTSLLLAARGEAAWGASESGQTTPIGNENAASDSEATASPRSDSVPRSESEPPHGESDGDAEEDAPGAPLRALSCLEGEGGEEGDGARRGVQKRDFQKRHRFELGLIGGYVAMDALSSTYITSGTVAFYPSEDFGLELLVSRTPMQFRLEAPFSSFDLEQRFEGGVAWQGIASGLFSPFHAKFRFTDKGIWHADFFLLAGAGRTWHSSVQGITSELGAGLKLYPWRFVSIRLDVRDFVYAQEVLGRASTTHNVAVMAGISVWSP